jgi:hypothetical protein
MVATVGVTTGDVAEETKVPPHEPEYHLHVPPVTKDPPVMLRVEVEPRQMGVADTEVGGTLSIVPPLI